jgi:hypothetical protein
LEEKAAIVEPKLSTTIIPIVETAAKLAPVAEPKVGSSVLTKVKILL